MLSKSSAVILPGILLLIIWWRRGHWQRTDWLRLVPLFAMGLAMASLTVIEQRFQIGRSHNPEATLNLIERILLAGRSVCFYFSKALWPSDLTFLYPRWDINRYSIRAWVPVLGVIGVAFGLWHLRRFPWARAGLFGLGCFVVALWPVLGFFDLYFFRYSYVADHFQYLASIVPVVLVTAGFVQIIRWRSVQIILAVIAITIVSGATWRYAHVFQNLETLWEDTVTKNPAAWLARNNLGVVLTAQDRFTEAAAEYSAALRLKPTFAEAHGNFGNLLARQGKFTEAVEEQLAAIRYDTNFANAYYNLGNVRALQGHFTDAITAYNAALRICPDFQAAKFNLELAIKKCDADH